MSRTGTSEAGFTLIELLVAMAVFSFMLLIIVVGFMNVVRLHDQALASNVAQDNARGAMEELVRAVRDSAGVVTPVPGTPSSTLCLASANGPQQYYWVKSVVVSGVTTNMLYRGDGCTASPSNQRPLTSNSVQVANFRATVKTSGAKIVKPQVEMTVTIASNNGTTTGSGASIACGPSNSSRAFCATVTLTSGAVPR
jgi:prepilin-type N-terminal cleavage/methylation domain-containing protein